MVTISPLSHNWAIRFLSNIVYADEQQFEQAVREGEFAQRLAEWGISP